MSVIQLGSSFVVAYEAKMAQVITSIIGTNGSLIAGSVRTKIIQTHNLSHPVSFFRFGKGQVHCAILSLLYS